MFPSPTTFLSSGNILTSNVFSVFPVFPVGFILNVLLATCKTLLGTPKPQELRTANQETREYHFRGFPVVSRIPCKPEYE